MLCVCVYYPGMGHHTWPHITSFRFISVLFSETRLKELRGTLSIRWQQKRQFGHNNRLSAERVIEHICNKCHAGEAVIRCLDCVLLDTDFLYGSCDIEAHKKNVFHNREAIFHGYLEHIPMTKAVVLDDNGQPHFCEQGIFIHKIFVEQRVIPQIFFVERLCQWKIFKLLT